MHSLPLVTIIIPTKDGESTISNCLESIRNQSYKNYEVLVIDSGSSDRTVEIAQLFPFVRIIEILAHTFNHGLTRNLGVKESKGEFILFTVQDAYASDNRWIEIMLSHFMRDAEVVGVCGQQVVPHNIKMNPHEWYRPKNSPQVREVHLNKKSIDSGLSCRSLRELCGWDNVNSMYRRAIFNEFPFKKTDFAEDLWWAKDVVLAGKKIIYDYNSSVFHYHHNTYKYAYKKTLTVFFHTYIIFGDLRQKKYSLFDYCAVFYRNVKYRAPFHWILFNWKAMYAREKASKDIKKQLDLGIDCLIKFHNSICKTPPQGKQNE